MPQRHDLGYRKRLARLRADDEPAPSSPDEYARELVRRGQASRLILKAGSHPNPRKETKNR